jgi:hemerythrin-like domain-containing protein
MIATQLLMTDHEQLTAMLDTLAGSDLEASGVALFWKIKDALELHTEIEETIFYPALESFAETSSLIEQSYSEHQELTDLLAEMSPGEARWDSQVSELRDLVTRHVEKEESELFPQAESLLGEKELVRMGQKIQTLKSEQPRTGSSTRTRGQAG